MSSWRFTVFIKERKENLLNEERVEKSSSIQWIDPIASGFHFHQRLLFSGFLSKFALQEENTLCLHLS